MNIPADSPPPHAIAWRGSLPFNSESHRTGAIWLPIDSRDFPMHHHPGIAAVLEVGAPPAADLERFVGGIYNQGMVPSCVTHSTCSLIGTDEDERTGAWPLYNADQLYREMGGTGANGVDTRGTLQRCVDIGAPLANSAARQRIGSYFFAPRDPAQFVETLKAAVAAGKCCVVALLLPMPFGWDSGDSPTSGYHQMNLVGYDETWAIFANSWGPGFGRNGFCRVKWSYLTANNLQNGYAFAATVDALVIPPPTPVPVPPPVPPPVPTPTPIPAPTTVTIAGKVTGAGLSGLAVGQTYPMTEHGLSASMQVTQINGPTPTPAPTPVPPDRLTVIVYRGRAFVSVTAKDVISNYVLADVTLTVGGKEFGTRATTPVSGGAIPAVWVVVGYPAGTVILATAKTADGRVGSCQISL